MKYLNYQCHCACSGRPFWGFQERYTLWAPTPAPLPYGHYNCAPPSSKCFRRQWLEMAWNGFLSAGIFLEACQSYPWRYPQLQWGLPTWLMWFSFTWYCAIPIFKQEILSNSLYLELLSIGKWDTIHHWVDIIKNLPMYKAHRFLQVEGHCLHIHVWNVFGYKSHHL